MNCHEFQERLPSYLCGELEPSERAAMDAHVRGCPTCARALEVERRLDGLIRDAVTSEEVSAESVSERVRAGIESGSQRTRSRGLVILFSRVLPIAAAVALTVGGGWKYFSMRSDTALYRAAVADHVRDLRERVGDPEWQTSRAELSAFALATTGAGNFAAQLESAERRVLRARACRLEQAVFAHFVLEVSGREVSVFVRRDHETLRGPVLDAIGELPVRGCSVDAFQAAGFRRGELTFVIVAEGAPDDVIDLVERTVARLG